MWQQEKPLGLVVNIKDSQFGPWSTDVCSNPGVTTKLDGKNIPLDATKCKEKINAS